MIEDDARPWQPARECGHGAEPDFDVRIGKSFGEQRAEAWMLSAGIQVAEDDGDVSVMPFQVGSGESAEPDDA